MFSRFLIAAGEMGCVEEALTIVAMLSVDTGVFSSSSFALRFLVVLCHSFCILVLITHLGSFCLNGITILHRVHIGCQSGYAPAFRAVFLILLSCLARFLNLLSFLHTLEQEGGGRACQAKTGLRGW